MADDHDPLLEAVTTLVPALLTAMEALSRTGRHLHPPELAELVAGVARCEPPLRQGLEAFEQAPWPDHLRDFRDAVTAASTHALAAFDGLEASLLRSDPVLGAYRALGRLTLAVEALYPVAFMLPPVNRFFLCEPQRSDEAFQTSLLGADPNREDAGVMHAGKGPRQRGGFSLYVPENLAGAAAPVPLVVALHGGSGHGRTFLWSWLREARSRGAIVIAPTSRGETWDLMSPEADAANLRAMVEHVCSIWPVDPARRLLTGMSDGGTFSYLAGLAEDSPFSHLAPISATFHPMLLEFAGGERLAGLPVYLVHGALDWMFPVDTARLARDALTAAGARVTYRELDDLSHTYPREESVRILDWLNAPAPA